MKKSDFFFLLFYGTVGWLLCLPSCKKIDLSLPQQPDKVNAWDTLPAITQEGKHTFGCLVDGRVCVPHGWSITGGILNGFFDESKGLGYGNMRADLTDTIGAEELSISYGPSYFLPSQYATNADLNMPLSFSLVYYNRQGFYAPDTSALGKTNFFKITKIDTAKNFVSGLFAFTLYRETNQGIDRTDSVVINEGRFDLRYYPQ
jgi:hypothetical protein